LALHACIAIIANKKRIGVKRDLRDFILNIFWIDFYI